MRDWCSVSAAQSSARLCWGSSATDSDRVSPKNSASKLETLRSVKDPNVEVLSNRSCGTADWRLIGTFRSASIGSYRSGGSLVAYWETQHRLCPPSYCISGSIAWSIIRDSGSERART